MRLHIFGAGGMGRETADIIAELGDEFSHKDVLFVTSDGRSIDGLSVVAENCLKSNDAVAVALGDPRARRIVSERIVGQVRPVIISSRAAVSPSARLGDGTIVCNFASVNSNVSVGRHVIINCHSQISHDCVLADYVTISPHVSCNGWVVIGEGAFIGAGAVIRNGSPNAPLVIGHNAIVGLGAVVTRNVAPDMTVVGLPAREHLA